jgi:hypothetical protein
VHEGGEDVLGVAAALLDQLRHDHGVLGDRVEDTAVAAEPVLVGERRGIIGRGHGECILCHSYDEP